MSSDLHDRTRPPSPDEGPEPHEKPKSSISITQVVGGALAAMTAAALGSRLSVAGTVVGAALASVVAAVAGAVYTASLRHTSRQVGAVLTRVRPTNDTSSAGGTTSPAATPAAGTTSVDDGTGWALPLAPERATTGTRRPSARPRIAWKKVLVAAALMFVVAAVALTGIELATGRALSGGTGTTVGRVADPVAPSSTPSRAATPTPSASESPSGSPTAQPSPVLSATPSSEGTAAEATAAPSAAPTAEPVPTEASSAGSSQTSDPAEPSEQSEPSAAVSPTS